MIYIEDQEVKRTFASSDKREVEFVGNISTTRETDLKASQVNYHVNFRFDLVWISKNIRYFNTISPEFLYWIHDIIKLSKSAADS